jgi:DNA mismatch repair protein MutS
MVNLELFSTLRDQDRQGSLVNLLDETITPMGGRMIRNWIQKPLVNKQKIVVRQSGVEFFVKNRLKREKLKDILKEVSDIERLLSKLSVGIGNARDLVNLKSSLQATGVLKKNIENEGNALLSEVSKKINKKIEIVITVIQKNIVDEPPIAIREGRMIREGVDKELDSLKEQVNGCRKWLSDFEESERKKTGISSLKVKFNEVFGFFIEVTKTNSSLVPSHYLRKQTMVNGERFITKELKEKEQLILSAEEKINDIEYKIYCDVLENVLVFISEIQSAANAIGTLDCILNFAHIAQKYSYIKPQIIDTGEIKIKAGRHAVVETLLENQDFVPNDIILNNHKNQLILITGPNMAGKSVFIRQVALIVLLNQMGSYVPAEKAALSIVDRIFVRSGASDVITSGLSTFMVEMVETAQILNSCTKDSLIVMDEIGRGTSTYDGISIAWAVAEHLAQDSVGSKTLFATHYHELQTLANSFPNKISNFHMAVEQQDGEPIFLHTLLPGGASHSYGVAVAKLAGIPENVTKKAWKVLEELEKGNHLMKKTLTNRRINKSDRKNNEVTVYIKNMNLDKMTPLQALTALAELQAKLLSK